MAITQITSLSLVDDAVTAAKIGANQIGNSELDLTAAYAFTGAVTGNISAGGLVALNTTTASNSGNVQWSDTLITDTYNDYIIIGRGVIPATDSQKLNFLISINGGSNYSIDVSSGMTYEDLETAAGGTVNLAGDGDQDVSNGEIPMARGLGNDANQGASFIIHCIGFRETAAIKHCFMTTIGTHSSNPGNNYMWKTGSRIETQSAINHMRVEFASGNITEGKVTLFGVKS